MNKAAPPGEGYLMSRIGFAGDRAITGIRGSGAPTSADIALRDLQSDGRDLMTYGAIMFAPLPPDQAQRQRVLAAAQQDFVQVTLALFASSFSSVPLQFLEAPGTKDGTEITVKGNVPVVMRFDPKTHLPAALGTMEYSDYRVVNGMNVPFRFVVPASQAPSKSSEGWERGWEIKEIRFNVKINPRVFSQK